MLLDVTAAPGGLLVAVGERGVILTSKDNGVTWKQQNCPVSVTLTTVRFASALQGWTAGHSGIILHTEDGGDSWTRQMDGVKAALQVLQDAKSAQQDKTAQVAAAQLLISDGPDKPFLGLAFKDAQHGLAIGAYGLLFATDDGGARWRSLMPNLPNPDGKNLYGIAWTDDRVVIDGEMGGLFESVDNGVHFKAVDSPYQGSFFGLLAAGADKIFAYGLKGHLFDSTDDGKNWSSINAATGASLSGAARLRDGSVVVVSVAGDLVCEQKGARDFARVTLTTAYPFTAVTQAGNGALVLAGVRGVTRIDNFSCTVGGAS